MLMLYLYSYRHRLHRSRRIEHACLTALKRSSESNACHSAIIRTRSKNARAIPALNSRSRSCVKMGDTGQAHDPVKTAARPS